MSTVELIPTDEWVYNLYKVEYWTDNAADGGRLIKTIYLASSCDNHMWSDANEHAPYNCNCISTEVVRANVGHPRVVGHLYGQAVYEDSLAHGRRIA